MSHAPPLGVVAPRSAGPEQGLEVAAPNLVPPPGNPRFPLFDSLRAIAALCVFGDHILEISKADQGHGLRNWALELGAEGVAIFFLISGFLLYRPFLVARGGGRAIRVRDYARRRVLRIVPAYWVALTAVIVVLGQRGVTSGNFWLFYGFGQIYGTAHGSQGIGVAWTLCVEVTFYALLPVIAYACAALAKRWRSGFRVDVALIVALSVGSLAFHQAVYPNDAAFWWAATVAGSFTWFGFGMLLAIASVTESQGARRRAAARLVTRWPTACWVAAVALFVVTFAVVPHPARVGTGGTAEHVLLGLAALFVLLPAVFGDRAGGAARAVLRWGPLAWIGLVSYGFYLYHADVITSVNKRVVAHGLPHPGVWTAVLALATTCAIAAASYYVVERPFLRLKEPGARRVARP